jgi:carbonic anhydrase/acetyltransferase-like protein (isoleucine patch superfamily)
MRCPKAKEATVLIEHQGRRPRVDPSAYVAPTAIISGDVTIGPESRVLHGAVITAEGAPVTIGRHCVVMEYAVVRGAGGRARSFPTSIGDYTLVGPHAYVVGATVEDRCFLATGSCVFNAAHVKRGCTVTIQAVVHIGTTLEEETAVPLQHVAIGTPATIFAPSETEAMMATLVRQGFSKLVFGLDPADFSTSAQLREAQLARYTRALASHQSDTTVGDPGTAPDPHE